MKNFKLNLKGLYGYRQSLLSRSPQPRDNREMSERRPSEERTLLAPLPHRFARYAAMLIILLTLGVGQMWGADTYAIAGEFNSWNTTANQRSGTGDISINITSTGNKTFKIIKNGKWCGNSGTMTRDNCTNWTFTYDGGNNCTISVDKTGTYTFTITNGTPTLSVTYPDATWSVAGGFNSWSTTTNTFSSNKTSINLTNGTTYEFKVYRKEGNVYYGNSGTMTSANCTNWDFSSSAGNAKITANITGTYVVELVNKTPRITVHYPVAISYDKGTSGTGTISGGAKTWGTNYTLSSSTFTRTGYTQDGWATSDGGDKAYDLGGTYSTHTAQTFYPHWTENMSTVSFVASPTGKGTFQVNSSTVTSTTAGVTTTRSVTAVPGTGYTFGSWAITGGATISSTSTNPTTVTGKGAGAAATLTCTFSPKQCAITFDKNGGTGGDNGTTGTYDATMPTITPPTRDHYTFAGYWDAETNNNGSGTQYYNADGTSTRNWNKNTTSTTTLYAKWTEITHDVRVGTNSHATTSPNVWIAFGEVTGGTVSATSISTGYRFNGWSSDKSGTFADASSASTTFYPAADNVFVTASIVAKTYSVTLDKNGGDSDGSVTATYNSSSLSSFSGAAYAGYSCDGYFTAPDGGTQIINSDGTLVSGTVAGWLSSGYWVKDAAEITLYAHWTEDATYYTLNYGVGTTSDGHVTVSAAKTSDESAISTGASLVSGTGVTITATPATHYKFVGWYTTAACLSRVSTDNPYSFSLDTDKNLYAKVELMTTTVSFNKNGGTGSTPASATATHGNNTLSTSITNPTKTGYNFAGWYDAEDGGNKVFGSGGVITASSGYADGSQNWTYTGTALTVYAHWTAKNYTVTLDKQSGSGGQASVSATYDAAMPSATMPTRTGYDFNGYYGSAGGSGTKYYNADGSSAHIWDVASATSIYAYWTAHNYSITYSPSSAPTGCTYTTKPTSADYNTTVDMVITPSTGYTVSVSAVDASSNVVTVTPGANNHYTFTQPASAVTVTVTATETMHTITINGGTAASTTAGVATTGSATAADPAEGKKFTGWTLGSGVTLSGGALTDRTINFTATQASSVTANYADRASVKMYFAKPSGWGTAHAFAWKEGGTGNGDWPGVPLSTTETINCVIYYIYQYYTEADGIGGAATGSSTWDKIIFNNGYSGDGNQTANLTISNGHYYYKTSSGTGKAAAITSAWYIKGTMNGWGETDPIIHNCATNSGSVDISLTTGSGAYEFKVYNEVNDQMWSNATALGQGDGITATMASAETLYSDDENVMKITPALNGTYTFTVGSTNASHPTIKVTFPEIYAIAGSFNSWSTEANPLSMDGNIGTANIVLAPSGSNYTLKVVDDGSMYGKNSTTITGTTTVSGLVVGQSDIALTADIYPASANPSYGFSYNKSTKALTVTYPAAHTVTYGVGTHAGTASVTSSISVASGKKILDSQSITFSKGDTKTGYTWKGWYNNISGSSSALGTGATYTSSSRAANTSVYACYDLVTYTITYNLNGGSNPVSPAPATSFTIESAAITLPTPSKTGYTFNGWYENADLSTGGVKTTIPAGSTGNKVYYAKWTPITYTIHFNGNGNTSGSMSNQTGVTYDAATTITANAFVKTGYNFAGWGTTQERANAGTIDRTDGAAHGNLASTQGATAQLWAVWTPKQSAISFDYQTGVTGYSSSGSITNVDLKGTYGAAMTALTGTMPSAIEGYAFTGFYDATSDGTKYYNADGSSAHVWDKDTESGTTLYARWEKAEITALTLDAAQVEPGNTIGVTPTVSPTPAGTTIICWEVQYAATGNPLSPQPSNMSYSEGKLTFDAPAASGLYKIVATLKTGNDCAGGTTLSSNYVSVQVAGSHTVTIAYKHSSTEIKASTSMTGRPLVWSDAITAPDIFGYSFSSWSAGDGITITDDDGATSGTSSTNATIKIKATYDGTLTANYTPKKLIYFKNTLGWENVYVNFYKSDYWNDSKGSGNNGVPVQNKTMTQLGETDIWYYDYGSDDFTGYTNTKPTNYVSFTSATQSSAENFWASGTGISVSYPARRSDDLADKANETGFYEATPMFVPLAGQSPITKNDKGGGKALYYSSGYWTKYLLGTGYTLEIYNSEGNSKLKEMDFTSTDELMPMKAVADLEANTTYKFQIKRHGDVYLGNSGTMTYSEHGLSTPWEMTITDFAMCGITTTAYGDYTFNFTYSANASNEYRLRISVDYPVADGDYRLVYTDNTRSGRIKPSAIVNKVNDGTDIVSFFVRHDETPVLRIQQATVDGSGNITWKEYPTDGTPTNQITGDIASAIDATGVYNFNLSMNGSGAMTVTSAEPYTGNYYIRTDAANSKWDNYRTDPDHLMTYSEYSITHGGYSHYYTHWVNKDDVGRKNVKFVIANDYSPCISDTLARETASGTWANIATFMEEGGDLKRSANVRFMWNSATNEVSRAYIDGSQEDGSQFLLLLSDDSKIKQGGATKTQVTFNDNGNWLYEANVSALPNAQIKLRSTWGEGTTIVQYFKGASDATETLVGGSGDDEYNFRLIYDFKTNRLLASYVPASGTISTNVEINADVMFVREHQGDIAQLTFSGSGAISEIQTAYGVLRFNKWTINNKDKSTHDPLPLPQPSRFERDLFYISFPFRVNLEEVFGFGTYGTHWIIQEYDGAARARDGYWADSKSFWRFIFNRKDVFLEPNKGYLLALDLDELGESSSVWANTDQVELYFPSYGTMPDITKSKVTHELEAHTCNIGPRFAGGDDRRVKDSHWNVMSVPTYINTSDVSFANTDWITAGDGQLGPNFLYTVNWNDNSLTATSGQDYTYKAMHAYIVQYCGKVTWETSVSPAAAPNRNPEAVKDAEYRLELRQNDQIVDQTFVRLSDDEHVTTGFEFNYDLSKEFNKNKANIYTMVTTQMADGPSITETAGNVLPMTDQTTVVPVGVKIATTGDYTFAIPEGTNGVGVTLIDNETGIRTSLSALDYTINLSAGTYDNRFVMEISPVSPISTDIENSEFSSQNSDVRKVMIDQILYIVKDGVMYDARGARVQ